MEAGRKGNRRRQSQQREGRGPWMKRDTEGQKLGLLIDFSETEGAKIHRPVQPHDDQYEGKGTDP